MSFSSFDPENINRDTETCEVVPGTSAGHEPKTKKKPWSKFKSSLTSIKKKMSSKPNFAEPTESSELKKVKKNKKGKKGGNSSVVDLDPSTSGEPSKVKSPSKGPKKLIKKLSVETIITPFVGLQPVAVSPPRQYFKSGSTSESNLSASDLDTPRKSSTLDKNTKYNFSSHGSPDSGRLSQAMEGSAAGSRPPSQITEEGYSSGPQKTASDLSVDSDYTGPSYSSKTLTSEESASGSLFIPDRSVESAVPPKSGNVEISVEVIKAENVTKTTPLVGTAPPTDDPQTGTPDIAVRDAKKLELFPKLLETTTTENVSEVRPDSGVTPAVKTDSKKKIPKSDVGAKSSDDSGASADSSIAKGRQFKVNVVLLKPEKETTGDISADVVTSGTSTNPITIPPEIVDTSIADKQESLKESSTETVQEVITVKPEISKQLETAKETGDVLEDKPNLSKAVASDVNDKLNISQSLLSVKSTANIDKGSGSSFHDSGSNVENTVTLSKEGKDVALSFSVGKTENETKPSTIVQGETKGESKTVSELSGTALKADNQLKYGSKIDSDKDVTGTKIFVGAKSSKSSDLGSSDKDVTEVGAKLSRSSDLGSSDKDVTISLVGEKLSRSSDLGSSDTRLKDIGKNIVVPKSKKEKDVDVSFEYIKAETVTNQASSVIKPTEKKENVEESLNITAYETKTLESKKLPNIGVENIKNEDVATKTSDLLSSSDSKKQQLSESVVDEETKKEKDISVVVDNKKTVTKSTAQKDAVISKAEKKEQIKENIKKIVQTKEKAEPENVLKPHETITTVEHQEIKPGSSKAVHKIDSKKSTPESEVADKSKDITAISIGTLVEKTKQFAESVVLPTNEHKKHNVSSDSNKNTDTGIKLLKVVPITAETPKTDKEKVGKESPKYTSQLSNVIDSESILKPSNTGTKQESLSEDQQDSSKLSLEKTVSIQTLLKGEVKSTSSHSAGIVGEISTDKTQLLADTAVLPAVFEGKTDPKIVLSAISSSKAATVEKKKNLSGNSKSSTLDSKIKGKENLVKPSEITKSEQDFVTKPNSDKSASDSKSSISDDSRLESLVAKTRQFAESVVFPIPETRKDIDVPQKPKKSDSVPKSSLSLTSSKEPPLAKNKPFMGNVGSLLDDLDDSNDEGPDKIANPPEIRKNETISVPETISVSTKVSTTSDDNKDSTVKETEDVTPSTGTGLGSLFSKTLEYAGSFVTSQYEKEKDNVVRVETEISPKEETMKIEKKDDVTGHLKGTALDTKKITPENASKSSEGKQNIEKELEVKPISSKKAVDEVDRKKEASKPKESIKQSAANSNPGDISVVKSEQINLSEDPPVVKTETQQIKTGGKFRKIKGTSEADVIQKKKENPPLEATKQNISVEADTHLSESKSKLKKMEDGAPKTTAPKEHKKEATKNVSSVHVSETKNIQPLKSGEVPLKIKPGPIKITGEDSKEDLNKKPDDVLSSESTSKGSDLLKTEDKSSKNKEPTKPKSSDGKHNEQYVEDSKTNVSKKPENQSLKYDEKPKEAGEKAVSKKKRKNGGGKSTSDVKQEKSNKSDKQLKNEELIKTQEKTLKLDSTEIKDKKEVAASFSQGESIGKSEIQPSGDDKKLKETTEPPVTISKQKGPAVTQTIHLKSENSPPKESVAISVSDTRQESVEVNTVEESKTTIVEQNKNKESVLGTETTLGEVEEKETNTTKTSPEQSLDQSENIETNKPTPTISEGKDVKLSQQDISKEPKTELKTDDDHKTGTTIQDTSTQTESTEDSLPPIDSPILRTLRTLDLQVKVDAVPDVPSNPPSPTTEATRAMEDKLNAFLSSEGVKGTLKDSAVQTGGAGSQQPDKRECLYKILVIGELGTGKTSIIKRYVHQFFSQHYRATIGVDFALKVLNWDPNTIIRLQLWDIAGQERFGNMTRVYYKEAVGAFIVFDVTRSATFDAVLKWKQDLDSKVQLADGSPIPCVLLANKCDQQKEGIVNTPAKMEEYCKENNFSAWFETSAKENINIEDAAKSLVSQILQNDKMSQNGMDSAKDGSKFPLNGKQDQEGRSCSC